MPSLLVPMPVRDDFSRHIPPVIARLLGKRPSICLKAKGVISAAIVDDKKTVRLYTKPPFPPGPLTWCFHSIRNLAVSFPKYESRLRVFLKRECKSDAKVVNHHGMPDMRKADRGIFLTANI